jgi:hypothetical protein
MTIEAITAKASELGIPTDAKALNASRPGSENGAAVHYAKLTGLVESQHVGILDRYLKGQATDQEADKAIAGLAGEIKTMDAAVALQDFAPQRDYTRGMEIDYKEYDPMQRVAIVYVAKALRAAKKGNTQAALEDFRKAGVVARHASTEDVAMAEYLTTVCLDHWFRGAVKAAEASEAIRPGLATMMKGLPEVEARAGVGTDFALIKTTIARIRSGEVTYSKVAGWDTPPMVAGKPMDDILKANLDMAERYALEFVVRAYENWENRGKIVEMLHAAQHSSNEETPEDTVIHALEALAMTFTLPLKNGEALTQAQRETLSIAMAASDIMKRTGKAPTLAEAAASAGVGETDPFSNKPYVLKEADGKVTVYSVGLDEKDDGGKPYVPGETQGTDISVRL